MLGSSEFPHRFLKSSDVANLLVDLARTRQIVRIFKGWLTVANDSFDPELVDVDLEHLTEARTRILEAAQVGTKPSTIYGVASARVPPTNAT